VNINEQESRFTIKKRINRWIIVVSEFCNPSSPITSLTAGPQGRCSTEVGGASSSWTADDLVVS
jgi:hypothetical protein